MLPYRVAYEPWLKQTLILAESDLGRFVITISADDGERQIGGGELHAGDYLWWSGYQRFNLLAVLDQ